MTLPAIYANLSVPGRAVDVARSDAQGVGLLRSEFLVYQTGRHPRLLLESASEQNLANVLRAGMRTVSEALYPRPVVYRSLDLRSNELRGLQGGAELESVEENPSLGCRGIARSQKDPDIFFEELHAMRQVREEGFDNLKLMLPFVRWPSEVEWALECLERAGLTNQLRPDLLIMVETPASILCAPDFAKLVDGVSIGSNDLMQLVLGLDRDNRSIAQPDADDAPVVINTLKWAIEAYRNLGIPVGICGDAPSRSVRLLEKLCHLGLSSISVSPDRVSALRRLLNDRDPTSP